MEGRGEGEKCMGKIHSNDQRLKPSLRPISPTTRRYTGIYIGDGKGWDDYDNYSASDDGLTVPRRCLLDAIPMHVMDGMTEVYPTGPIDGGLNGGWEEKGRVGKGEVPHAHTHTTQHLTNPTSFPPAPPYPPQQNRLPPGSRPPPPRNPPTPSHTTTSFT